MATKVVEAIVSKLAALYRYWVSGQVREKRDRRSREKVDSSGTGYLDYPSLLCLVNFRITQTFEKGLLLTFGADRTFVTESPSNWAFISLSSQLLVAPTTQLGLLYLAVPSKNNDRKQLVKLQAILVCFAKEMRVFVLPKPLQDEPQSSPFVDNPFKMAIGESVKSYPYPLEGFGD